MNRYAILTHEEYEIDFEELDGYAYSLRSDRLYLECEAENRNQAKLRLMREYPRGHIEYTDGMSIRKMRRCECDGSLEEFCPKCSGSGWYVPGGFKER